MGTIVAEETMTITQRWLGMKPYVLLEVGEASDGSGEPSVYVEAGGNAEEQPLFLPLMALCGAAEGNPVADMLREVWGRSEHPVARVAVEAVAREFNPDWVPFVRGEAS